MIFAFMSMLQRRPLFQLLDMVICFDANAVSLEGLHGVFRELLVEHWEHLRGHVIDTDVIILFEFGVESHKVFFYYVVKLCRDCIRRG